jgi:hypothetical protein
MRLLNAETLEFAEFFDDDVPAYAILSHTWGREEVTYKDMGRPKEQRTAKEGYAKLKGTCEVAVDLGFQWIWVDTCCIDKSSSAELSEAINSMYAWYERADVCFAYLSDVLTTDGQPDIWSPDANSDEDFLERMKVLQVVRWFTRGWTLQELLAPRSIYFYSQDWTPLGTRKSLSRELSQITRIDQSVLTRALRLHDRSICVAKKMSWAARRHTSRTEDKAYSLLGLFGVHMPLLYGEGQKAFIRLQEEIIRVSDDHTIFAWSPLSDFDESGFSLLAPTSECFDSQGGTVIRLDRQDFKHQGPFSLTNKGLRITLPIFPDPSSNSGSYLAALACRYANDYRGPVCLRLSEDKSSPGFYHLAPIHGDAKGSRLQVDESVGFDVKRHTKTFFIKRAREDDIPQPSFSDSDDELEDPEPDAKCWFRTSFSALSESGIHFAGCFPKQAWSLPSRTLCVPGSRCFNAWCLLVADEGTVINVVFGNGPINGHYITICTCPRSPSGAIYHNSSCRIPSDLGSKLARLSLRDTELEATIKSIVVLGEDILVVDVICRKDKKTEITLALRSEDGFQALIPGLYTFSEGSNGPG